MSLKAIVQRVVSPPPLNVGGGDLMTRMMAILGLLILAAMITPQAGVTFPLVKISLLITAEFGLVMLMLSLFLRSKMYFAGLQMFFASLAMLWFAGQKYPWVAILVGLLFIALGAISVVTRRSRLNAFLELSSRRVPLQEIEAAAAAAATEVPQVVLPGARIPVPKPPTEGATR